MAGGPAAIRHLASRHICRDNDREHPVAMGPFVIITGRSGRIGSRCAERFSQKYTIIGLDLVPPKQIAPNELFFPIDLEDESSIQAVFKKIHEKCNDVVASVIHLAAYYSFSGEHPEKY